MKRTPTAKRFFGAVVAALTLTLVASVAPAAAAEGGKNTQVQMRKDTGWDIP